MSTLPFRSVKDAAAILGVTDARVRQICIAHNIGQVIGTTRILTDADIRLLKATPRRAKATSENK